MLMIKGDEMQKKYKGVVEELLQQCVLPCFQSQYGHLRSRACWVAGRFSSTKFKDGRGSGATFKSLLEAVVLSMKNTEVQRSLTSHSRIDCLPV